MKTEIVNNIAKDGLYQLQYYKNIYLKHKKINKILLILLILMIICLVLTHVYYYLKF